jgi:hypothetical protein
MVMIGKCSNLKQKETKQNRKKKQKINGKKTRRT